LVNVNVIIVIGDNEHEKMALKKNWWSILKWNT